MITSASLKNIRVFKDPFPSIELSDLNILCGTNSSGKSTFIKSFVLLHQAQILSETSNIPNGVMVFSGPFIDLGNYQSLVSENNLQNEIGLSFNFTFRSTNSFLNELIKLQEIINGTDKNGLTTINEYSAREVDGGYEDAYYDLKLSLNFIPSRDDDRKYGVLKSGYFQIEMNGKIVTDWEIHLISSIDNVNNLRLLRYCLLLPEPYFKFVNENFFEHEVGNKNVTNISNLPRIAPSKAGYITTEISLKGLFPETILINTETKREFSRLPFIIEQSMHDLVGQIKNLVYIGPMRSPAKRYYLLSDQSHLMSFNDKFAFLLNESIDQKVLHFPPQEKYPCHETIDVALSKWLFYIRTGKILENAKTLPEIRLLKTKPLIEVDIKSPVSEGSHPIIDSGFGYSQLLPMVLESLLAKNNSIILVEQPEVHLNPALQVRIAEFFLSISRTNRQIILETHSEHIVNTIRVLIAEDDSRVLYTRCKLYFFEERIGSPLIHNLNINMDGTIPKWPYTFFGEAIALSGRLLRAQKKYKAK